MFYQLSTLRNYFYILFISALLLLTEDIYGGTKSLGMGGFGTAYALEVDTVNPAGIVELGNRLDYGFGLLYQTGRARVKGNTQGLNGKFDTMRDRYWPAGTFGYNKMIKSNLSFAILQKPITGVKSRYNKVCGLFGTTKTGVELEIVALCPTISWQICKNHCLGLSFNYVLAREKYKGFQATIPISKRPNHVTNKGYNYSRGYGLTIGYKWQMTPQFVVGVAYTPKNHITRFRKYDGLKPSGIISVPAILHVGCAFHYNKKTTATFDFVHFDIKRVPTASNSPFAPHPAGAPNGPGAGWRNLMFYTLGGEYKMNEKLTFRIGGTYARQPITRHVTIGTPECVGLTKFLLSMGTTYKISEKMESSISFSHGFRNTIKGKNSIPVKGGGGEYDITYSPTVILIGGTWIL